MSRAERRAETYPYRWRVRTRLPERQGARCRVLVRSRRMNSALVQFEDGYQVVTSRNYLRKAPACEHFRAHWCRIVSTKGTTDVRSCSTCGECLESRTIPPRPPSGGGQPIVRVA